MEWNGEVRARGRNAQERAGFQMSEDREAALETGYIHVSRGPHGDTTRDWYAGTETEGAQMSR